MFNTNIIKLQIEGFRNYLNEYERLVNLVLTEIPEAGFSHFNEFVANLVVSPKNDNLKQASFRVDIPNSDDVRFQENITFSRIVNEMIIRNHFSIGTDMIHFRDIEFKYHPWLYEGKKVIALDFKQIPMYFLDGLLKHNSEKLLEVLKDFSKSNVYLFNFAGNVKDIYTPEEMVAILPGWNQARIFI